MREQFAFSGDELSALLTREHDAARTALILSTCNRCELYWAGDHDCGSWFDDLARTRGVTLTSPVSRLDGRDAVSHLFTVTAGLDSQILGETEILGQVRRAYDAARAAGTTTREMDAIFSAALSAGRRVRRETLLGRHPASVSSAAVELAAAEWGGGFGDRPVVVLGAGEAAEGVLRALHQRGATRVALVNRNPERAAVLAEAWGAEPHPWEGLRTRLAEADLLMVATAAAHPVIGAGDLFRVMAERQGRPLVVIDLAVPRNVEPAARSVRGLLLYDLDDLQRLCCPAAAAPAAALTDAERLLAEELVRLDELLRSRVAAPRLAELHKLGAQMAEQESAWALAQLDDLSEGERRIVREMADRLVRRVLFPVSRSMRRE